MTLIILLILGPIAAGALLAGLRSDLLRRVLVGTVTLAVCVGTVALACLPAPLKLSALPISGHVVDTIFLGLEVAMALYVIYVGLRANRPLIVVLMLTTYLSKSHAKMPRSICCLLFLLLVEQIGWYALARQQGKPRSAGGSSRREVFSLHLIVSMKWAFCERV